MIIETGNPFHPKKNDLDLPKFNNQYFNRTLKDILDDK